MVNIEEIIEYNKGREVIYASFSKLFLNLLDNNSYKMLEDIMPFIKSLKSDNNEDYILNDGIDGISKFIEKYKSLNGQELNNFKEDIDRDYTRLYCLGNGVELSESVYTSVSHLSKQDSEIEVRQIYESCNFVMQSQSNEPQDHISYQLMFMSFLCKAISKNYNDNKELAEKLLEIQKDFLENHLLNWVEELLKRTIKFEESYRFYLPATYFIAGFLKADYSIILGNI